MTPEAKVLVTTKGESVVSTSTLDVSVLQPCTQEEADHHIMLHCAHTHQHGLKKIMVYATDTDVLVLATATVLQGHGIWLVYDHSKISGTLQLIQLLLSLVMIAWCKGLLFRL